MNSGLEHINKVAVITTYGAPQRLVQHAGDSARRFVKYSMLPMCSESCLLDWSALYCMDGATQEDRATFLAEIRENCIYF